MLSRQPDQLIAPTYEECIDTHHHAVDTLLDEHCKRCVYVTLTAGIQDQEVDAEFACRSLHVGGLGLGGGIPRGSR
jgi:hypothetical protein